MADHSAFVSEVRELMTAGNKREATRLVRRYIDGSDTALAEDLADRGQTVLDRETQAHANRIAEARRAHAARAIADRPRATRTRPAPPPDPQHVRTARHTHTRRPPTTSLTATPRALSRTGAMPAPTAAVLTTTSPQSRPAGGTAAWCAESSAAAPTARAQTDCAQNAATVA